MLIKPLHILKYLVFTITSFSIINPLTLLIIPLIGSLIILSYSYKNNQTNKKNETKIMFKKVENSIAIKELIEIP